MKKKIFTILLIFFVGFSFIVLKSRYSIKTTSESEFIIINWRMTPSYINDLNRPVNFTFHLKDKHNKPITDAVVSVMASMDHAEAAPLRSEAVHDQNGFYKTALKLTKHGDWTLYLTIKKKNGEVIKKELAFTTKASK